MTLVMGIKVVQVRASTAITHVVGTNIGQVRVFPVLTLVMGINVGEVMALVMGLKGGQGLSRHEPCYGHQGM